MRFEELGRYVSAAQDEERESLGARAVASERFISALRRKPKASRTRWAVAATATTLAAAAGLWLYLPPPVPPSAMTVAQGVVVGRPVVAQDRAVPLSFSDGSRLVLLNGSRATVRELHADGASVELESGKTQIAVHHRPKTRWTVSAGPYQVGVTGTKFDLEWLPSRERFELLLEEGSVVVTTNQSTHAEVKMNAAERLVIDHGQWRLSPAGSDSSASLDRSSAVVPEPQPASAPPEVRANRTTALPSNGPTAPTWQELGKVGKYTLAFAKAQEFGLPRLHQTEAAQSLLSLAEVCRFSGHPADAISTLYRLRQRFANSNESAVAAFQLGRLSQGEQAAQWFRDYLRERPNGELAREASGRLLEVLDRAGNHAAALEAAKDYLARYPSGPHAPFARQIRGY